MNKTYTGTTLARIAVEVGKEEDSRGLPLCTRTTDLTVNLSNLRPSDFSTVEVIMIYASVKEHHGVITVA